MAVYAVEVSGPVFDGRANKAMDDAVREIERTVAEHGSNMVRANLNTVLRKQTPYYRLQVVAKPDPPHQKVTDQGVIYGPWLEGTGSRNRTTRFKGYATFRRTTQQLAMRATGLAENVLRRFIGRMN
jgi:hypothetical protein